MNPHRRRVRVALVDRFRLVTQALDLALSSSCRPIPVPVQSLHSTAEVLTAILRRRPEVVVLGDALGGSVDREQLVEDLTAQGCRVVALADEPLVLARLRRAGAAATLPLDGGLAAVQAAIEEVVELAPPVPAVPVPWAPDPRRVVLHQLGSLTRRELAVLAHLMRGRSAAEIARAHVVAEATVRTQVKSILRKLEVPHQLAAIARVHQIGWEPPYPEAA
ncbi:MAG: LuxR C-terminal-related transcriptional regulator [Nocardioides sp.]